VERTTRSGDSSFLDLIQDGGVEVFQQAIRDQVEALAPLDPSGKRIVYQLGNEIATTSMSEGLRLWATGRGITIPGAAMDYDPEFISYYVEYQLAPTVAAMLEASATAYGDPNKVTIVLGSVNNGGSAEGKAWLDALLDYTVKGTFAPSLADKRVYELIDIASVHYIGGTSKIEPSWDKWAGVGTISGLWTTEEVGIRAARESLWLGCKRAGRRHQFRYIDARALRLPGRRTCGTQNGCRHCRSQQRSSRNVSITIPVR